MTYMKTSEVAACLGVGVEQVLKLARAGRIPAVADGKKLRFPRPAWEKFVQEQSTAALAAVRGGMESNGN